MNLRPTAKPRPGSRPTRRTTRSRPTGTRPSRPSPPLLPSLPLPRPLPDALTPPPPSPHHSYKKSPSLSAIPDAVNSLTLAITLLTEQGRFRQAADRQKEVGTILKEADLPAARDAFEKAGEWYQMEDAHACVCSLPPSLPRCAPLGLAVSLAVSLERPAPSPTPQGRRLTPLLRPPSFARRTANAILKEAAEISGTLGDYKRAVDVFVQVGEWSLTSPLTKYSVKELWLKAGLWCVPSLSVARTCLPRPPGWAPLPHASAREGGRQRPRSRRKDSRS